MYNKDERALFAVKARNNLCSHAYIVDGAVGVGKLDFALYCAQAMLCTEHDKPCGHCPSCRKAQKGDHPDILVIGKDKAANVDSVRQLIRRSTLKPNDSDKQIFIVCNADRLNEPSQNALLKLFEEPPESVAIFLLTENRASLLPTVLSRGQRIHLDGISDEELRIRLTEKFPKLSSREISHAVSRARGNYGEAERFLSKESRNNRAKAEEFILFALTKQSYELATALIIPKFKRDQLRAVLNEFISIVTESEKDKYGIDSHSSENEECAMKLKKASKRALAAMCEVAQLAIIALENNANVTVTATKLSVDLITAAAR